jgi:hypothetical protein
MDLIEKQAALRVAEERLFRTVLAQVAQHHFESLQSSVARHREERKAEIARLLRSQASSELDVTRSNGREVRENGLTMVQARIASQLSADDLPLVAELSAQFTAEAAQEEL